MFDYPNTGAVQSSLRTSEVTCREEGEEVQLPPGQLDIIFFSPLLYRLSLSQCDSLFPLLLNSTTERLGDLVTLSLERLVGTGKTEQFLAAVYQLVLQHAYPVFVSRAAAQPATQPLSS